MRVVVTLLILGVLVQPVLAGTLVEPAAGEPTNTEVTQVDNDAYPQVTIYVSVADAAGQIVIGLAQEQFEVTEDGQPVTITSFSTAAESSISTVLIIDRSVSMETENKMEGAKEAAQAFVNLMRAQDQMAVVVFDERPSLLVEFTPEPARLRQAIQSIYTGECTAIYDGMQAATDVIDGVLGRQLAILLTDGRDCREFPEIADRGSQISVDEAIAYAQDHDVAFHVIGLGERGSTDDLRKGIDEPVLQRIAVETGGDYYYTPTASELKALYESLAGKVQREYILTYESPRPTHDGTRRDIQVKVAGQVASSDYLEEHLLNVQSNWIMGIVFLVPLFLMLLLPAVTGALQSRQATPLSAPPTPGPDVPTAFAPDFHETVLPPTRVTVCSHCGTVPRQGARFCGNCGQPLH